MSSYLSEQLPKWLIWPISIFFGLFLICFVVGLSFYDIPQFLGNLLAGLAGVFLSFAIALLFVDNLVDHYRKQQWAKVRNYTLGAIAAHLSDFATAEIYVLFQVDGFDFTPIFEGRNTPYQECAITFQALADELRKIKGDIGNKSPSDVTVELYESAKWDLDQIQLVLTPRVIQSYAEQDLIDVLIEFDQARRELHNGVIGHKLVSTQSAFPALISLVEVSGKLYGTLCKYWQVNKD